MDMNISSHQFKPLKTAFVVIQFLLIIVAFSSCQQTTDSISTSAIQTEVQSPEKINHVTFFLSRSGQPGYFVRHRGEVVVDSSMLGFDFRGLPALNMGMEIVKTSLNDVDDSWEMPWGEQTMVRNVYRELKIELSEKDSSARKWNVYIRAYDDGVALRHEFPEQPGLDTLIIMDEFTEFQLTGDHQAWWTPGDWDSYEHPYFTDKLSEIDALAFQNNTLAQSHITANAVNTPFTMRATNGVHLSIHEANLTDYAGMTLKLKKGDLIVSDLVGSDITGYKVKRAVPFQTPWRSIQIGDKATDLLTSNLIVNLNDANKLGDVSWFEPKKYLGIWWEMHIGEATWDYESGNHGATTENTKKYIDFASENGFKGVLVEGWNTGWDHWIGFDDREGIFDFVTTYPDYDLKEVVRYGKEKGVEIIMHHETSAAPRTYEAQLDTAYALMKDLGIHSVKTGYVGPIIPKGEYHHGQWMVNHYRKVLLKGAENQVAINAHEPIKPTGIRRTYPNAISREGARGQEFNAWASDGGNPAEHLSILAFTRMLAGPMDFTPGVFDITLPTKPNNQINTTLAHQLALYVVIYSPVQMACDLPENYEGKAAFQFIKDVGVDWEKTVALNGEVGDFVTMARQERETGNWFVGGITDENPREVKVDFNFLQKGKTYKATIYKDGAGAHYKTNPTTVEIETFEVTSEDSKNINLAAGGGFAISIK